MNSDSNREHLLFAHMDGVMRATNGDPLLARTKSFRRGTRRGYLITALLLLLFFGLTAAAVVGV